MIHSKQRNRNDVVLATKVRNNTTDKEPNNLGLSRRHIIQALEGSLQRLQTEYIDLYQVKNEMSACFKASISISKHLPYPLPITGVTWRDIRKHLLIN
jgi:aryl-alcohol dehydrogenase-like predicted oxidoreductase